MKSSYNYLGSDFFPLSGLVALALLLPLLAEAQLSPRLQEVEEAKRVAEQFLSFLTNEDYDRSQDFLSARLKATFLEYGEKWLVLQTVRGPLVLRKGGDFRVRSFDRKNWGLDVPLSSLEESSEAKGKESSAFPFSIPILLEQNALGRVFEMHTELVIVMVKEKGRWLVDDLTESGGVRRLQR